jgi:hypothetical protein
MVTEVRDLLNAVAREIPEAVSAPIFREDVTTNLQADAVIALSDFIRRADRSTARALRHAIEAIRQAVAHYDNAGSMRSGRGNVEDLLQEADQVIRGLRRQADTLPRGHRRPHGADDPAVHAAPSAPVGLRPAGPGDAPVPVAEPGRLVATPASKDQWFHRRADAPVVPVWTERFDPKITFTTGTGPQEDGWGTDIRVDVRRIQAGNGQWIRHQEVVLPVKPMAPEITPEVVERLESELNAALDAHVNRGYELPVSKDQLNLEVQLVVDPEDPRAIELRPGRTQDASDLGLDGPDGRHWGLDDWIYTLVHEVLHYVGLPDEYRDSRSLLRQRTGSSAVRGDGIMAGGAFDSSQPMPERYLRIIESVVNTTAVLGGHPLTVPETSAPAASPTPETGTSWTRVMAGRPDDVPPHPGPSAHPVLASQAGGELSGPQAATLSQSALSMISVPATGDGLVHALGAVAAAELFAIGGGRPATPAELRAYLADALTTDLPRDPRERRFWPLLDEHLAVPHQPPSAGPAEGGDRLTDDRRRALAATITAPDRTAGADDLTLAAAAVVLGLRVTVVPPDGVPVRFGPPSGRPVVLVRLSAPGPYSGSWGATEPVADTASSLSSSPQAPPPGTPAATVPGTSGVARPSSGAPAAARNTDSPVPENRPPRANLGVDPFARD